VTGLQARFDWYAATFEDLDDERVPASLALAVGGSVTRGKGRNGYAAGWDVLAADGALLAQVYGRSARIGEVHISIPGGGCDVLVPLVRRLWPTHRVARADSAIDFLADFAVLDASALRFAEDRGLSFRLVTDSHGGATRYLGSPRSEVMVRLYKKSEQLRALHPDQAESVPDGVVRAEVQVRPGKRAAKEAASYLTADDLWGLSEWSAHFAVQILDLEPVRTVTHFRRASSWSRTLHYLGLQYGPVVEARIAEVGREAVVDELLSALRVTW
jgi:hypothetical protein